jgi:Undecaprenyl-phosphate galactose phosphotransferase WbaP
VIALVGGDGASKGAEAGGLPVYPFEDALESDLLARAGVKTCLLILEETTPQLREAVNAAMQTGFHRLILVPEMDGLGNLGMQPFALNSMVGFEVPNRLMQKAQRVQKRVIDIVGAGLGLVLLAPVFLILAILIKLDSPGPVFYRQTRIGRDGRPFPMLKFRTMVQNADQVLAALLREDAALRREWKVYQKLKDDPRITPLGEFLRKYSLDELPQLWNVLKGEMSLIGPRPFFPDQRQLYDDCAYAHYSCVRPGITGMWQVNGRSESEFTDRAYWDAHYVRNWSLWLDLYILAKTFWVVIRREGAY